METHADALKKVPYQRFLRPVVEQFDFGHGFIADGVTAYIKSNDPTKGALYDLSRSDDRVSIWLYGTPDGDLVGYIAYGTKLWPLPEGERRVHHLKIGGVDRRFHGRGYYGQIMQHALACLAENASDTRVAPVVTAFVHDSNVAVKRILLRHGFAPSDHTYTHQENGETSRGMVLRLHN